MHPQQHVHQRAEEPGQAPPDLRNEKVRGSNPLSSTKAAGQWPARILKSGAGSGNSAQGSGYWPSSSAGWAALGGVRRGWRTWAA